MDNLYPGSPFEREVLALNLLHAVIDTLDADADKSNQQKLCLNSFFSSSMVKSVLNVFVSSWDKSRRLASDLLLRFPLPWPCYSDPAEVLELLEFGLVMTGSPKQRESDAGALIVRNIFHSYSGKLGWRIEVKLTGKEPGERVRREFELNSVLSSSIPYQLGTTSRACAGFVLELCRVLKLRSLLMKSLFACVHDSNAMEAHALSQTTSSSSEQQNMKHLLCNGLILAIKYCLVEAEELGFLEPGR